MSPPRNGIPSGRASRAARLAVSSVFTGFAPAMALVNPGGAVPPLLQIIAVLLLVMTAWLWLRLPFTGASLHGDIIVITAWWSRKRLHRHEVARFRSLPYGGPFFYIAWTITDGPLASRELEVELTDGTRIVVHGTVCNRRASFEMTQALNHWLENSMDRQPTLRRRDRRGANNPESA